MLRGTFSPGVTEAFAFVLRARPADLRRALASRPEGVAAALLRAALALAEGDVAFAIGILKTAFVTAAEPERAYLSDILVPLFVSRGELDDAERYNVISQDPQLLAAGEALSAVIAARRNDPERSSEHAARAELESAAIADPVLRARVQGRLALAAYERGEYAEADRLGQDSAALARRGGGLRYVAIAYSLRYAIAHDVLGDFEAATRHAEALIAAAEESGDESLLASALGAAYELAAERADLDEARRLQQRIRQRGLPPQYAERFAGVVADALQLTWQGDFAQFRAVVAILGDAPDRRAGERALCLALGATGCAALKRADDARRLSRRAFALSRPADAAGATERRYRRLARARRATDVP